MSVSVPLASEQHQLPFHHHPQPLPLQQQQQYPTNKANQSLEKSGLEEVLQYNILTISAFFSNQKDLFTTDLSRLYS